MKMGFMRFICAATLCGALAFFLGGAWHDGRLAKLFQQPGAPEGESGRAGQEASVQDARVVTVKRPPSLRLPAAERLSLKQISPAPNNFDAVQSAPSEIEAPDRPRRVAPEGTFYLLEYVSARTDRGIIGFEPGQRVTLVEPILDKGMIRVTDGVYKAEIHPSQMTNNLDVAEMAKGKDAESQRQVQAYQEGQRRQYAAAINKLNEDYSTSTARTSTKMAAASAVGSANSRLNEEPRPAGGYYGNPFWNGSPYGYLFPNTYRRTNYYDSSYHRSRDY